MAAQPPQVQPCRYKVGKTLGAGSYSVVKECVHIDTGRCYAAKVINKRLMAGREHMVRNEIAVLKKVSMGHKNILTLVDYFETMNNLYLVTDLALGGELFDRICRKGSYYESDAADLIRATLSAVAYLHDHGIVHRDLKPENLLFRTPEDNADLLIADFGLSRIMDEEQFHVLTTTCGTPGYMAPEIFKKTGHGKPVDVWALGVITYFLLCGYTPFDRDSDFEEMQAILKADYSFTPVDYWRGVSDDAKDFVTRCLTIDPARRMTAHEALHHPFVAGYETAPDGSIVVNKGENLLPNVKKNFNARRTLHAAIDTVRAINKLREGQNNGSTSSNGSNGSNQGGSNNGNSNSNSYSNGNSNGHQRNTSSNNYTNSRTYESPTAPRNINYAAQARAAAAPPAMLSPAAPPPLASAAAAPAAAAAAATTTSQTAWNDSGYGTMPGRNPATDVDMDDAPPLNAVPASLRPGMQVNKVVETSKGLWTGVGSRG